MGWYVQVGQKECWDRPLDAESCWVSLGSCRRMRTQLMRPLQACLRESEYWSDGMLAPCHPSRLADHPPPDSSPRRTSLVRSTLLSNLLLLTPRTQ